MKIPHEIKSLYVTFIVTKRQMFFMHSCLAKGHSVSGHRVRLRKFTNATTVATHNSGFMFWTRIFTSLCSRSSITPTVYFKCSGQTDPPEFYRSNPSQYRSLHRQLFCSLKILHNFFLTSPFLFAASSNLRPCCSKQQQNANLKPVCLWHHRPQGNKLVS